MAKSLIAAILVLLCGPLSAAIVIKSAPKWAQLTMQQQLVLAPLAAEWDGFADLQRHRLLGVAEKYPKMSAIEQGRVRSRLQDWAKMTPEQRKLARQNYRQLQELPHDERLAVKKKIQQMTTPQTVAPGGLR